MRSPWLPVLALAVVDCALAADAPLSGGPSGSPPGAARRDPLDVAQIWLRAALMPAHPGADAGA